MLFCLVVVCDSSVCGSGVVVYGCMASKRISKMKKVMAGLSSGGDKKATSSQRKKVVDDPVSGGDANKSTASRRKKVPKVAKKENLVEQMRKHKKGGAGDAIRVFWRRAGERWFPPKFA